VPEAIAYLAYSALIGASATAVMDVWAVARKRLLGIPALDYGLVGRWLVYLTRGRFRHNPIAASPAIKVERLIGWIAHYLIGIAFAAPRTRYSASASTGPAGSQVGCSS